MSPIKYEFAALSVFAACIVSLQALSPLTARLQTSYIRPDFRRASLLLGASELKIGQVAPTTLVHLGKVTAVIALTDCGECTVNFPTPHDLIKGVDEVVLLAPQPGDFAVKELAKSYHASVRPLSDALVKSLNAVFVPRLYIFDKSGRLSYLQKKADLWPAVLRDFYDGTD
jgi:hypothetical protein